MTEVITSEQPLDEKQRAFVNEAYSRFEIFRNGCKDAHDAAREARLILRLKDPKQDAENTKEEDRTIQLQTLKSTFNNCVADQIDNMPKAVMTPETQEMQGTADDLTDIVKFVLSQNNFETFHRRRVEDFLGVGTSITQIAWDEEMDGGKGNIALIRWPLEAFLWDPYEEDIQNARALIKVSWHPLSWYEAHYPEKAMYIRGDTESEVGKQDIQEAITGEDEERAMLLEYWYRTYDSKKNKYAINVAYLAGGALLSINENVYSHGMYPFVFDVFSRVEGSPVGEGMVSELVPMMRYINRYARYIDKNLSLSAKVRLLVNRNSGIDKSALADWSNDIIEGDRISSEDVNPLITPLFTSAVSNQMLQLQSDIKMDSGQNQFTRGETTGGVTAASAISSLQEAGGKITRMRTNTLTQGFRRICEQILWLISQFYDAKRSVMVTGNDGNMRSVRIPDMKGNGAYPPPPYTVQVEVERRNPLVIQAQNDLFIQAYSMAAQSGANFPLSALFQILHVDGKEQIMPAILKAEQGSAENAQQVQAMEALQSENENLKASVSNLQKVIGKYAKAYSDGGIPETV